MRQFPDSLLDDSQIAFRETAIRFANDHIAPNAYEWEEAEAFPKDLYRTAGKAGILGAGFPEDVGGAGGTILHVIATQEGLLRGGSTGVIAGLGSLGIALPPVIAANDPMHIDQYVRPTIRGDKVAALAITEPGGGSDVASIRTKAVKDGDHYVVSGAKMFITSGVNADFVVALCRTGPEPHSGLTFFIIDRTLPGYSVSRALKKTGWRASDTAELSFNEVRVPATHRVGPEGSGFLAVVRNFQAERLVLAAYGHTSAQIAYENARDYAQQRTAFGRRLSGFQVTRHKLAEMWTQIVAAKTLNYTVASRIAAGETLIAEVSAAKNFSTIVAEKVCREAVQILGGMGYMRETVVERLSRDVRLLAIGGGTYEIMNEIITKSLFNPA
ncbi:MAG: acyl-CoA dehydrogenase family protein [Myxococcales bacterium]|nr:acyl-CoA dehydrogenase family protein [Myxococcales bacterium]